MKLISGFARAKKILDRRTGGTHYEIARHVKDRLKLMFGTDEAEEAVSIIIDRVKTGGDRALLELGQTIDGVVPGSLEVSREEMTRAAELVDKDILNAIEVSAGRIRAFHDAQKYATAQRVEAEGCARVSLPLERVGVYAPGGTASYPSSVLMTVIPARSAGVKEIILATPPDQQGRVPAITLAAAGIAGADRVFCMGGAQAVAAMAYGTQTVPTVDKIFGPGNLFVMLAKKQVFGQVGIDGLQGPSEVLIVADGQASIERVVGEILAQAEHDVLAQSILITTSPSLARHVMDEVDRTSASLERSEIIRESLEQQAILVTVESLEEAVELSNMYGPEHLVLYVDSSDIVSRFTSAGCIFTGKYAAVAMGDYIMGPSHALPTGGTSRFSSPLNVADFIRYINIVNVDEPALRCLGPAAEKLATAEGLTAHARSIENMLEGLE